MTTEPTPEQIDAWRWQQAQQAWPRKDDGTFENSGLYSKSEVIDEYRRLVRENVLPPPEPDQDTLDARAVCAEKHRKSDDYHRYMAGTHDDEPSFQRCRDALIEIKARVRREAYEKGLESLKAQRLNASLPGAREALQLAIAAIQREFGL